MFVTDRLKIAIRYMTSIGVIAGQKDLGRKLGYNNETYMSQIVNMKTSTPKDFWQKLSDICPEINIDWIRLGEGEMLKSVNQTATNATAISTMAGGVVNNIATRGDEKIISPTGEVSIEPHHAELIALREENKALKDKVALLERIISEKETIIDLLKK